VSPSVTPVIVTSPTCDGASPVAALHELGDRLAEHVRLEERQLFPLIEEAMPAAQLAVVAVALESAEHSPGD
jgi:iron-sulfur cluster repair protein YtfE (RIC family)